MDIKTIERIRDNLGYIKGVLEYAQVIKKIDNLVNHDVPQLILEIERLHKIESIVYRLSFTEVTKEDYDMLSKELQYLYVNQYEWPDDEEEEDDDNEASKLDAYSDLDDLDLDGLEEG